MYSLSSESACDLAGYADLFARNHITGRRLFLLTGDDLLQIGILSVGHRKEFLVSILLHDCWMGLWVGGLELLAEPVGWGCGLEGWSCWLSLLDGAVGWRVGAVG